MNGKTYATNQNKKRCERSAWFGNVYGACRQRQARRCIAKEHSKCMDVCQIKEQDMDHQPPNTPEGFVSEDAYTQLLADNDTNWNAYHVAQRRIAALEAENTRLREALEQIIQTYHDTPSTSKLLQAKRLGLMDAAQIARRALAEEA